jgi:hypothetical protein
MNLPFLRDLVQIPASALLFPYLHFIVSGYAKCIINILFTSILINFMRCIRTGH